MSKELKMQSTDPKKKVKISKKDERFLKAWGELRECYAAISAWENAFEKERETSRFTPSNISVNLGTTWRNTMYVQETYHGP